MNVTQTFPPGDRNNFNDALFSQPADIIMKALPLYRLVSPLIKRTMEGLKLVSRASCWLLPNLVNTLNPYSLLDT